MSRRFKSNSGPFIVELRLNRARISDPSVYPFNLPAVRGLDRLPLHPKVTFLIGENGSGKSTLLEAIAVGFRLNPEGGNRNFNFTTRASHSNLCDYLTLVKTGALPRDAFFLRAESFFNVATEIDKLGPEILSAYGGQSLHEQSHGESFFSLFENRFRDNGLYLMDEPEAALSPRRQLAFLAMMHDYVRRGGQFIIATHSPIIMSYPNADIYQLDGEGIRKVPYLDTEHYLISRGFLANPQRSLKELLVEEEPEEPEEEKEPGLFGEM